MEEMDGEEEPPGKTPFFRAKNLEKSLRLKKIFIKFEGAGVTGTQKDRISRQHVIRAKDQGYDTISLATCGNYGASISYYANIYGMKSVIAVPEQYSGERNSEMISNGSQILSIESKYEDLVGLMRERSVAESWYDSSPGSVNSDVDFRGYSEIAYEIVSQLGHSPSYVAVPVGNGTTLAGIYNGFKIMKARGSIKKIPVFIGSSTPNGNPVVESWKLGTRKVINLDPSKILETPESEPLVAYRSFDGQRALDSIYESRGMLDYVSDSDMLRYANLLEKTEMLSVLPASASALAVVDSLIPRNTNSDRDIVVVITGRSRKWTTQ
jgi:threonine synthase